MILIHTSERRAQAALDVVSRITSLPHHPRALSLRGDLRCTQTPDTIVETSKQWLASLGKEEKIHILVNNAAVELAKDLGTITPEDFASVYDLNVRGTLFMMQAVLPCLAEKGRVINISSMASRAGFAKLSLYSSSKAAMEGLTRCWSAELGHNGTTVNTVNPGPVPTEMMDNIPEHIMEAQLKATPVGNRAGTIEEVADVVAWLAGEESRWVTGQTISVSGGLAMY